MAFPHFSLSFPGLGIWSLAVWQWKSWKLAVCWQHTDCAKVQALPSNPAQKMHSLPSVFLLFQLCHPKLDDACSHLLHLVVCGIMPTQLCAALGEQQAGFLFSFERVLFPCTGRLREIGASRSKLDQLFPAMSGGLSVPVQSRCGGRAASLSPCPRCCILGLGAPVLWQMYSPVAALNHLALLSFITSFTFHGYILNQGYFY